MPTKSVDPTTGEVLPSTETNLSIIPDPKTVTSINKVAGKNPLAINLRDHPEFSGKEFLCVAARFSDGDIGGKKTNFIIAAGFVYTQGQKPTAENAVILITGSSNVYNRLAEAASKNTLPVVGTLRLGGRAWFLD